MLNKILFFSGLFAALVFTDAWSFTDVETTTSGRAQEAQLKTSKENLPKNSTQDAPSQLEAQKYFKEAEDMVGTANENSERQIALFQKALELDPGFLAAAFDLGVIYTRLRDPLKALNQFGTVLEKSPATSALSLGTNYLAALNLRALGEIDQAKEHLQRTLTVDPKHADALSLMASIYLEEGKTDRAKTLLEQAAAANPKLPDVFYNLALISQKSGKTEDALKYYQNYVELMPKNAAAHLNLAILLAGKDRMDEAAKYAEKATQLEPNNMEAWTELGKIQMLTNKQAEAQDSFRRAILIQPKWSEAHRFLVTLLLQDNKLGEANTLLVEAAKNNPNEAAVYTLTGQLATRTNDPLRALKSYGKAHELKPTAETAFDFAMAYARNSLDPLAEEFFNKAIKMKSDFGEAWFNLGILKDRQNNTAEALTAYRQAESYGIREGILFFRMGCLYARLKDIEKAFLYLEKAIQLDPQRWKAKLREALRAVQSDLDSIRYRPEFQKLIQ